MTTNQCLPQTLPIPQAIGEVRARSQSLFNQWALKQHSSILFDPPHINIKAKDGLFFDACGSILAPTLVEDICIHAGVHTISVEYTTDVTHINLLHCGRLPDKIYSIADEVINNPSILNGQTVWLMPSLLMRQEESNVLPNVKQWMQFLQNALKKATEGTIIILGMVMPHTTIDPQTNVRLDRRMITMGIRKWIQKVIYVGVPQFYSYDPSTMPPQMIMMEDSFTRDEPYAFFVLNSKTSYSNFEVIHLDSSQPYEPMVLPNIPPVHVRLDCSIDVCSSNNELIKLINGQPSDMTSTAFGDMDEYAFPPQLVAQKITQPKGPKPPKWFVADFNADHEQYQLLAESDLNIKGVHYGLVSIDDYTIIATHWPPKGKKKMVSADVRSALFMHPHACEPILTAVVWTKFDLLVTLKTATDLHKLAEIWQKVDNISMT